MENKTEKAALRFLSGFALLFIIPGLWLGYSSYQLTQAESTKGLVIDYVDTGDSHLKPEVIFSVGKQLYRFRSRARGGESGVQKGQWVMVFYHKHNPNKAEIDTFSALWFFPVLLFSVGSIMMIPGVLYFRYLSRDKKRINRLQQGRYTIEADFDEVRQGGSAYQNGQQAYRIYAHWYDETLDKEYCFESQPIWFNPEAHIPQSERLMIYVDPQDMQNYHMDLSFLNAVSDKR